MKRFMTIFTALRETLFNLAWLIALCGAYAFVVALILVYWIYRISQPAVRYAYATAKEKKHEAYPANR